MPVYYCSGSCGKLISVSFIEGGNNPVAKQDPEHFAVKYVQCPACHKFYCQPCALRVKHCCNNTFTVKPKVDYFSASMNLWNAVKAEAERLIALRAFQPVGAMWWPGDEITFISLARRPDETTLEHHRRLHRKLVSLARSAEAQVVGLAHLWQDEQGEFLLHTKESANGAATGSLTRLVNSAFTYPLQTQKLEVPYSLLYFLTADEARAFLPGRWQNQRVDMARDIVEIRPDGVYAHDAFSGHWMVEAQDFNTSITIADADNSWTYQLKKVTDNILQFSGQVEGQLVLSRYQRLPAAVAEDTHNQTVIESSAAEENRGRDIMEENYSGKYTTYDILKALIKNDTWFSEYMSRYPDPDERRPDSVIEAEWAERAERGRREYGLRGDDRPLHELLADPLVGLGFVGDKLFLLLQNRQTLEIADFYKQHNLPVEMGKQLFSAQCEGEMYCFARDEQMPRFWRQRMEQAVASLSDCYTEVHALRRAAGQDKPETAEKLGEDLVRRRIPAYIPALLWLLYDNSAPELAREIAARTLLQIDYAGRFEELITLTSSPMYSESVKTFVSKALINSLTAPLSLKLVVELLRHELPEPVVANYLLALKSCAGPSVAVCLGVVAQKRSLSPATMSRFQALWRDVSVKAPEPQKQALDYVSFLGQSWLFDDYEPFKTALADALAGLLRGPALEPKTRRESTLLLAGLGYAKDFAALCCTLDDEEASGRSYELDKLLRALHGCNYRVTVDELVARLEDERVAPERKLEFALFLSTVEERAKGHEHLRRLFYQLPLAQTAIIEVFLRDYVASASQEICAYLANDYHKPGYRLLYGYKFAAFVEKNAAPFLDDIFQSSAVEFRLRALAAHLLLRLGHTWQVKQIIAFLASLTPAQRLLVKEKLKPVCTRYPSCDYHLLDLIDDL